MPKNSKSQGPAARGHRRDLTRKIRIVLGALLALNLIAAGLVMFPACGSADDLERELASLQSQLMQKRTLLEHSRLNVAAIEKARGEGDHFLNDYFLSRRTADSALLSELTAAASKAQIKERDGAQTTEYIEGSDSLSMMTITANFEGTYRNLLNFINELDHSDQLLIIESMSAAPQQGSNILTVSMKIDAFIRDDSAAPAVETAVRGRGRTMNLAPKGVGAEPKKLAILVVLLVLAGGAYYWTSRPDVPAGASTSPASATLPGSTAVAPSSAPSASRTKTSSSGSSSYGPRSAARGGRTSSSGDDFRPTLKPPEDLDFARVDPTLRTDLLAKLRKVSVEGGSRSLFEFYTPPPPPPPPVVKPQPIVPKTLTEAELKAAKERDGPPRPPPPPPIPLKFYGLSGALRSTVRRAFFLDGEDIVQAGENETIRNRYKVIRIGVNSAVVEDTVAKNQQTLPMVEEAQ